MSDFVNRLERELLAAGKRSQARRAGRRLAGDIRRAGPGVFVAMTAAVALAAIVAAGLLHSSAHTRAARPSAGSRALPPGFGAHACHRLPTGLPRLIRSDGHPSRALLSMAGFLRRPATAADRIGFKTVDRWPYEVLAVYARYIRVIRGPDRTRVAVVPAVICGGPVSAAQLLHPPPLFPHQVLLMQLLSAPPPPPKGPPPPPKGKSTGGPATVYIGTAADIRNGTTGGFIEGLQVSVVPNGVARIVFIFPNRSSSMTIHDNIGMDWIGGQSPISTTWYAADGSAIRTFTLQTETHDSRDVLFGNGIWLTRLRENADTAIDVLDLLLGRRPSKPYYRNDACGVDHESDWPGLSAFFSHGRFVGYSFWPAQRRGTVLLATAKGLRPGDLLSKGRRLYGRTFQVSPAQGGSWSAQTSRGRIFGYTSGDPNGPRATVASIDAGDVGCPAMTP